MPTKTRRVKKNDAGQNNDPPFISHITESELQAIAAIDFNQPGTYNWIKKITPSVADKKGVNALVNSLFIIVFIFTNHFTKLLIQLFLFCRICLHKLLNSYYQKLTQSS
jgi:hypothetical protein